MKRLNSGVALMVVLVALMFMSIISYEIIYSSRVDLRISANARNRIQAWYLSQSAARIAMLRLHLYAKAKNNKALKSYSGLLDKIWSFPLPSLPFKDQVFGEDHRLPGEITSIIKSEGSLIPINLIDGNVNRNSSDEIAKQVKAELLQLIESFSEDDAFVSRYSDLRAEDLVNPLIDWIDKDKDSLTGGDESRDYDDFDPPYEPRNDRIPVLSELHMIKGWNDELFRKISPQLSVIKTKATVNPNYIPLSRLKSFHPRLSQEDLRAIDERRREDPFKNIAELETFIRSSSDVRNGIGFEIPFKYGSSTTESIFRIEASGIVGIARRVIRLGVRLDSDTPPPAQPPSGGTSGTDDGTAPTTPPKDEKLGDPKVVTLEVIV